MRTENYLKHGVISVLLVFALVFSMVTISAPLASAGALIYNPGGSILTGPAGGTVTVTHTIEFNAGTDGVTNDGAYTITMSWLNYDNLPSENLTYVSASAIFTTGPHTGESQIADVIAFSPSPAGDNTRWTLAIGRPIGNKDNRNGQFDVDIVLGLYGDGGVPHTAAGAVGDNHPIEFHFAGVGIVEPFLVSYPRDPITIDVIGVGVTVSIAPGSDSGWTDDVLTYTVTVTNTGEAADNFALSVDDDLGWTTGIDPVTLELAGSGGNDTADLTVTVGSGTNNVQVTATSDDVDNSDNCVAIQLTGPNVKVEVSPDFQENLPGTNLYYEVVTTNIGTVPDNYTVIVTGDATSPDWDEHFSTTDLLPTDDSIVEDDNKDANYGSATTMYIGTKAFGAYENQRAFVQFDLSGITAGSTINSATLYGYDYNGTSSDNIIMDAKRVDNDAWTEGTITWNNAPWGDVGAVLDTDVVNTVGGWNSFDVTGFVTTEFAGDQLVSILLQSENEGLLESAGYTSKDSSYSEKIYLSVDYTPPGPPVGFVVELAPGENDTRTMTVEIHENAIVSTVDNVTVTATSEVDNTVSDSDTVQAHAKAALIVGVYAEPAHQDGDINRKLVYDVTIVNEGAGADNYDLTIEDTLGWGATFVEVAQLLPTDDGAATEGFPDLVEDGGVDYNTYNGWSPTYLSQRPYFKFDISVIPAGSKLCGIATFWATGRYGPSYPGYTDTWHLVDAMSVDDDSWDETTLTWNNAPPVGAVLDTENFAGDAFVDQWTWLSWDVWDYVDTEFHDGEQFVTIALKAQVENADIHPNGGSAGWFRTKDGAPWWAEYKAYLEIYYQPGDTTTQVELDVGENVTLSFGVIIPGWVTPSNTTTITITATSQTDNTVTDENSVTAHADVTLRAVDAWIDGPTSQETYKDPLTYVVEIHNTGMIADMYKISAHDLYGWPLYVEPQEVWLKPSHSTQVALSVTIPYQTPGGTTDDIIVHIQGKLASGTPTDVDNSQTRVTVQASSKEIYGVDLNVYPSIHQTGHPDSPLTWLVTVTNTGNMTDTYDLDFSQLVADLVDDYPDWQGGLDQYTVTLEAYEEESILLTLTVPDTENMRTGVHNDIDITVTSQTYQEINDTQRVTAQVRQQMPHVPQGEIKLQAVAGYVAIDIWPTYYDFGVLNEMEQRGTPADYFTIRNVGNVYVDVSIVGMDATSKPGEPAANWTLGDGAIGIDTYALWWTEGGQIIDTVTKDEKILTEQLDPRDETQFDLKIQAPSTFTTPAKMWTKVAITARKLHPQP